MGLLWGIPMAQHIPCHHHNNNLVMGVNQTDTEATISLDERTSITVLFYGATVLSWKRDATEQLWLSEGAILDGSKAVRGGIPLVFPVFGKSTDHPATNQLPQHGFARTSVWQLLGITEDIPGDRISVQFGLGPEDLSNEAKTQWNHDFTLIYTLTLKKESLTTSMMVENTGKESWEFNFLFHTYFRVSEVEKVSVSGLNTVHVTDKVSKSNYVEQASKVSIQGEVDRVYENVDDSVSIDAENQPIIAIDRNHNLTDVVVWNPWTEKAESMTDFKPKSAFHNMICVECGNVSRWNKLAPSQTWTGQQTIKSLL